MTDRMAALSVLCEHDTPGRAAALQVSSRAMVTWVVMTLHLLMAGITDL